MSGIAQIATTLADGVLLLCALSLILFPAPKSARTVLLFEIVLVGAGSAIGASGIGGGWDGLSVALGIATACVLATLWLFRSALDEAGASDAAETGGGWPCLEDSVAPASATTRLRLPAASGFVLMMVIAVLAAGSVASPASGASFGAHGSRLALAVGLTTVLVGAAVAGRKRACGLVQAAGVLTALLAVGWTAVRLLATAAPDAWQTGGLPGTPASWLAVSLLPVLLLLLALLAMRAMSATLRDWLLHDRALR